MVSPAQKKQAVEHVIGQGLCSVRRACHYLGLHRSTYRYRPRQPLPQQIQLYQRIVALSWHYPRYGYRRIRALLAQEGWLVSRKQVQRIRRKEGLKVRPKPQRLRRQGVSTGLPTQATHRNHVWTWDFIFDRTDKGSTLKMLTMLDEYTRQCLAIRVERQIRSDQVLATLWQNGYIESFHSRFRDECLNREWLLNLREARVVIEDWRLHYNTERPHSRLGYLSPEDYIKHQIVSP